MFTHLHNIITHIHNIMFTHAHKIFKFVHTFWDTFEYSRVVPQERFTTIDCVRVSDVQSAKCSSTLHAYALQVFMAPLELAARVDQARLLHTPVMKIVTYVSWVTTVWKPEAMNVYAAP